MKSIMLSLAMLMAVCSIAHAQKMDVFNNKTKATKAINKWFTAKKITPVSAKKVQLMDGQELKQFLQKDAGLSKPEYGFALDEIGNLENIRAMRVYIDSDCADQPFGKWMIVAGHVQTARVWVLTACGKLRCYMGYYPPSYTKPMGCEEYLDSLPSTSCSSSVCDTDNYISTCVTWINLDGGCIESSCTTNDDCK